MREILLNHIIETQKTNVLWANDDYMNLLHLPMFAIEIENKKQVVNWNKACVDYYQIPPEQVSAPQNYYVKDFFKIKDKYYQTEELDEIRMKLINFYETEIENKPILPQKELNCFTVFLPQSNSNSGFYREYDRFTNVMYRAIKEANILLVTILIAPITNLYSPEKVLDYLMDNIL